MILKNQFSSPLKNHFISPHGARESHLTEIGNSLLKMRHNIFNNIKKINWKKGFFRKDIGWRVIKNIK